MLNGRLGALRASNRKIAVSLGFLLIALALFCSVAYARHNFDFVNDFTKEEETAGNFITINATYLRHKAQDDQTDYLWRDEGEGNIGNFTYYFSSMVGNASSSGTFSAIFISNATGHRKYLIDNDKTFLELAFQYNGSHYKYTILKCLKGVAVSGGGNVINENTRYWFKMSRSLVGSDDLYKVECYTDSSYTQLDSQINMTLDATFPKLRYIEVSATRDRAVSVWEHHAVWNFGEPSWSDVETWNFNIYSSSWHDVETWSFKVQHTLADGGNWYNLSEYGEHDRHFINRITRETNEKLTHLVQETTAVYLYQKHDATPITDFEWYFKIKWWNETSATYHFPVILANATDGRKSLWDNSYRFLEVTYVYNGTHRKIRLTEIYNGEVGTSDWYSNISENTFYYLTLNKTEAEVTLKIYNNTARTNQYLLASLNLTLTADYAFTRVMLSNLRDRAGLGQNYYLNVEMYTQQQASNEWHDVETWSFKVQPQKDWHNVETWSFKVDAQRYHDRLDDMIFLIEGARTRRVNNTFPYSRYYNEKDGLNESYAFADLLTGAVYYKFKNNETWLDYAEEVANWINDTNPKNIFYHWDLNNNEWVLQTSWDSDGHMGYNLMFYPAFGLIELARVNSSYESLLEDVVDAYINNWLNASNYRAYFKVFYNGTIENSDTNLWTHSKGMVFLAYAGWTLNNQTMKDYALEMALNYPLSNLNLPYHIVAQNGTVVDEVIKEDVDCGTYLSALCAVYYYTGQSNTTLKNRIKAVASAVSDHVYASTHFRYRTNATDGSSVDSYSVHGFGLLDEAMVQAWLVWKNNTWIDQAINDYDWNIFQENIVNNTLIRHASYVPYPTDTFKDATLYWNVHAFRASSIFYNTNYTGIYLNSTWQQSHNDFYNQTAWYYDYKNTSSGWVMGIVATNPTVISTRYNCYRRTAPLAYTTPAFSTREYNTTALNNLEDFYTAFGISFIGVSRLEDESAPTQTAWHDIETWSFKLQNGTSNWNDVETWSFKLKNTTSASWHDVETWTFNVQNITPPDWHDAETWSFKVTTSKLWHNAETFSFLLQNTTSVVHYAGGAYLVRVFVKRGDLPAIGVNVTIQGVTKTTNLFGRADFTVELGTYDIIVSDGEETQKTRVYVNRDMDVGVQLSSSGVTEINKGWILLVVFIILVSFVIVLSRRQPSRRKRRII